MEHFDLDNYKYFLGRTTVIYGETGTGKSTITKHILKTLSRHCDQIMVFSPTDPQNKTYSDGCVPTPLIHYNITVKVLEDLWARSEMMAAVYKQANELDVLKRLFSRLSLPHVNESIRKTQRYRDDTISRIRDQYVEPATVEKKIGEVDEKYREIMTLIYKRYISENASALYAQQLSKEERFSLDYLGFNPNMVVIFDDCTAQMQTKEIKKSKVFHDFFYRNRWAYLSIIICAHNDKSLEQDIRKNTFVNIFTSKGCATGYFANKTNCFDNETIVASRDAIKHIQEAKIGHTRLAYLREENKFYLVVAKRFPEFTFGAPIVRLYCDKIRDSGGVSVDRNNKFYDSFFQHGEQKK